MPKVSVIIPIYNTEKYIRKCLDSVCNQTLQDIEIICVNDCSPDNSLEILQEYASSDNRIKIINFSQNKGAAVARNTAIDEAKGEYIGFVDSDDYIDLDFYEKLYERAKKDNADIVIGNIVKHNQGKDIFCYNMIDKVKQNKVHFNGFFCVCVCVCDLLKKNRIFFTEGLGYGEDRIFPILASYFANKVLVDENVYYHYVIRQDSASKNYYNDEKKIKDFILSSKMILDCFNELDYSSVEYSIFMEDYLFYILFTLLKASNIYKESLERLYFHFIDNLKYNDYMKKAINNDIYESIKNRNYVDFEKLLTLKHKQRTMEDFKLHIKMKKDQNA